MIVERTERIPAELDAERLDRAVAALLGRSRGWARRVIGMGGVYLDRKRVRTLGRRVRRGQRLDVCWADPPESPPPRLDTSAILFHSAVALVVDKPAGVASQAARHRLEGTLPHQVARLLGLSSQPDPAHRLDQGASGLVLMGLQRGTRRLFAGWFQARRVQKIYVALAQVTGDNPLQTGQELEITLPLQREGAGARVASAGRGQEAITRVRCLRCTQDLALLELRPLTGRTHQLRVHCAAWGWPLLGDTRYAPAPVRRRSPRLCLHAHRLVLPASRALPHDTWEAPLPPLFLDLLGTDADVGGEPDGVSPPG